ncbi:hypothetical protein G7066_02920 [Leucobacter coleopterorum]|uniref:FemAB family protein n=1 Tax=Leucobacter coleopterorum TaxID=2714933 RepID=A0ABX6JUJ4_9MICO|nr:hypothetical protein [Leucobacter coleopterorum]QIM17898.1 hypothetical protein G7066_02920 [Leucobacter coleopterorum]
MYRMQWELIMWARENGAIVHDLIGSPPRDRIEDTEHPLYGVGQYKLRLSKSVIDYVGVWELALRATPTKFWRRWGEPVARRLSLQIRKDPYY